MKEKCRRLCALLLALLLLAGCAAPGAADAPQKENGKTVLIVTHDLESAIKYADEVIILGSGEVFFSGTVQECLKKTVIEQVFDVKQKILYDENNTRYVVFEKEDV